LAEAFFGGFKRDYVYQACLKTLEELRRQAPCLGDAVASRVLRGVVSQKQDSICPKLSMVVHHRHFSFPVRSRCYSRFQVSLHLTLSLLPLIALFGRSPSRLRKSLPVCAVRGAPQPRLDQTLASSWLRISGLEG